MSPRTQGHALVIVPPTTVNAGGSFEADVAIAGGLLHASKVRQKFGACGYCRYEPRTDRAWPIRQLREIRWLDADDQVAA